MKEMHSHGIIHRDLKPENIMLSEDVNGMHQIKILDFGLSTNPLSRREESGQPVGTMPYMAPEILHQLYYSSELHEEASFKVSNFYF